MASGMKIFNVRNKYHKKDFEELTSNDDSFNAWMDHGEENEDKLEIPDYTHEQDELEFDPHWD